MARFEEVRSISCPLLFEGEAYSQWINVMKYFILAQDFELWDIIEEGYIEAPKKKKKQMSENDTKAKLNSRAMHILFCGLNEEVSKKVSTCKRAKEMWEKLERLYVKEEKKDGAPSCANLLQSSKVDDLNGPEITRQNQEGINHTRIFSSIPKGSAYQREGINKVKVKDLKPKRIKDYLECKISQRNLNQPRKSAQAGPVVSSRDIPFVIQLKQIIEAPR
ncbi:hypothetical protein GQ457_08G031610 [Hibiscus cannabinus]